MTVLENSWSGSTLLRSVQPAGGRRRDVDPDADGLASKAGAPTDTLSQSELRKMELAVRCGAAQSC